MMIYLGNTEGEKIAFLLSCKPAAIHLLSLKYLLKKTRQTHVCKAEVEICPNHKN